MTLPSSGTLTYNTIRAEFGSPSSNVYLSLYVRGSQYTPSVPINSDIPTSATGQIAVDDFYGTASNTDFATGTGGSHNTGGKGAIQYYGLGGPSLPSFDSTSIKVGSLSTTVTKFYNTSELAGFVALFPSNTYQNSNFTSRVFTAYGLNTSSVFVLTTSGNAGTSTSGSQPSSNGTYTYITDVINASGTPTPPSKTGGANLGQYISIKAF
jgi:hypothetical protein|tara:strand:- start:153 stop:782 length:630 start_codon:yes stop_codon:yes gene_type:complete